eukprot:jgi/Botrbrau1/23070/Bobra.0243s0011.1
MFAIILKCMFAIMRIAGHVFCSICVGSPNNCCVVPHKRSTAADLPRGHMETTWQGPHNNCWGIPHKRSTAADLPRGDMETTWQGPHNNCWGIPHKRSTAADLPRCLYVLKRSLSQGWPVTWVKTQMKP